jgi:hypothetical protein
MNSYEAEINELRKIQDRLRSIRDRTCEPKNNGNDRYLGLSNAVSGINKAIDDMMAEWACS